MVVALRTFTSENEDLVKRFVASLSEDDPAGIAWVVLNRKGETIASGITENGKTSDMGVARLRAMFALMFEKNTHDLTGRGTGDRSIDAVFFFGGGTVVKANGAVVGSVGVAGRSQPAKMFPGRSLWDHEIAFLTGEYLKGKLELEGDLN